MLWVTNSCYIQKQQLLLIRRLNNRRGLNLSPRDAPSKCRETSCTSGPPAGPWMCLCALLPWRFYNWSDTDWVVYTPPDLVLQALPSRVPHLFCLMEQFHIRQNLADFFFYFSCGLVSDGPQILWLFDDVFTNPSWDQRSARLSWCEQKSQAPITVQWHLCP